MNKFDPLQKIGPNFVCSKHGLVYGETCNQCENDLKQFEKTVRKTKELNDELRDLIKNTLID